MGSFTVTWVRSDGRAFSADGGALGLISAEGLDEPNVEVFTQKAAVGDGDLVTGARVGSRALSFTLKARQASLNGVLRRSVTSFFNARLPYDVYVTREGVNRYAAGCMLDGLEVPVENPYKPITVKLSFLMPEGYFLSTDGFGRNIAGVDPRCGYPYAAAAGYGRLYGLYAYAETVYLDNDGDAATYCKAVITARGTVTNPKLVAGDGFVRFLGVLHEGDALVIDGKTRAATLNGTNVSMLLDKASRFEGIVFAVGANRVGFSADVGSNLLDVYVYYNKRYIGT
jgi:hypothetical protein